MPMSFINKMLKISIFLPEGVTIDFENAKRASDVKAVELKKKAKIHDDVFLATGISPSRNTLRLIGNNSK
jgi:ribosomal silencing factor RsfS